MLPAWGLSLQEKTHASGSGLTQPMLPDRQLLRCRIWHTLTSVRLEQGVRIKAEAKQMVFEKSSLKCSVYSNFTYPTLIKLGLICTSPAKSEEKYSTGNMQGKEQFSCT